MRRGKSPRTALCIASLALAVSATSLRAGGPRFVTGTAFAGTGPGGAIAFYTPKLTYSTDPADLASGVPHNQADALVAAAAAVWNVPYASITLTQGGELAEHVSSANAFFNGTAMTFPADVSASNYATIPIAVIYDTDGSVTGQLLGAGASSPSSCRQNGVTSSVDSFSAYGQILHALIILNGRCAGSTPQQLTQLEYQTMRAFGRVLGLAWSQLNDNVFTGTPQPTANNETYWPVMHPIDVVCGPYTYQCMQNPFALRLDDISELSLLYPVAATNTTTGKIASLSGSDYLFGQVYFPTGTGMEMANITVTRRLAGTSYNDSSELVSGVSGAIFQANGGNRVSGGESAALNSGFVGWGQEGEFFIGRIPVNLGTDLFLATEAVNPLYSGSLSLGNFQRPAASLSGAPQTAIGESEWPGQAYIFFLTQTAGAAACAPGNDGSEGVPASSSPTGFWSGQLCGMGHQSWFSVSVKPGRTWTIETTAVDESGNATLQKAQPVLGLWHLSDPGGTAPTVASAPFPMNALAPGVTQLSVPASSTAAAFRFVVEDQYGAGRPDFNYQARVLYADTSSPATMGQGGGLLTIVGAGFAPGNVVLVNGVRGTVTSLSSTQISAIVPSLPLTGASLGTPLDVEVRDLHTGGSSIISAAVSYTAAPDRIQIVAVPSALFTGSPAMPLFTIETLTSDGLAPAAGATVIFTVTQGSALLGCGSSTCTGTTAANGQASTQITGLAAGTVVITATEASGGASVTLSTADTDPVRSLTITQPSAWLAGGASASWTIAATAALNSLPAASIPLAWSSPPGATIVPQTIATSSNGIALATLALTAAAPGAYTAIACAWTSICATWTVNVVGPSQWSATVTAGAGQSVRQTATLAPITVTITDGAGHPLPGATATVYQSVDAWEGACPANGPCPAAPVLAHSQAAGTADANGQLQITPLQLAAQPQVVNIAVVTGTLGFTTFSLIKTP